MTFGLRTRVVILAVVCVLAVAGASTYVLVSRLRQDQALAGAPGVKTTSLVAVRDVPHIIFRNTAIGPNYGMVAMVALSDPQGPRAITDAECDRVYGTAQRVICLSSSRGVVTRYAAHVLAVDMKDLQPLPLTGIPSRARLSKDGDLAATTSFTAGDSYAGTSFSTRTVISRVGGATVGDLERFTLIHDGHTIRPVDRNFWGVTFADDDDTFYATVKFSGHTWLVRGSLSQRTVTTLHEDAECPSLSPGGTAVVFKQRHGLPPGQWRLVRYELATGKVTPLAEKRSVDDQVEWLDDTHVIYGIPRTGRQAAIDDVWSVPADGTGTPQLLIPQAWSPAVVR